MDRDFVKKFLKGSVSATGGTLATVIFHFLSITLMTRWASKETLGIYFLVLAIANGGKVFANLGLDLTLVHFLVSEKEHIQQDTFSVTIWTRLLVLLIIVLLTALAGNFLLPLVDADEIAAFRWYIPVLVTLMSFRELFFYVLQGLQKYQSYAVLQTSSALLKVSLIALLSRSLDVSTLLEIEFAMLGATIPFQLWTIARSNLRLPVLRFNRAVLPKILQFGLPLYVNSILSYLSEYGATFIVGTFLSATMVAAYEVARKVPEGFRRLFVSFEVVYFPSLSSLFGKRDTGDAQKLMNKSLVLLASGTFVTVLGGLLFSHEIILLLFSKAYLDVRPAFVLLLLAVCLHLLSSTMGYSLVSAGRPQLSTKANVAAIGTQLLLSLALIPTIGYVGGAIAYACMGLVGQALGSLYLRRLDVRVDLQAYARPYLFLGLTTGIYLLVGSESFPWRVALLLAYVGLCVAFIPDCAQALAYVGRLAHRPWLHQPR